MPDIAIIIPTLDRAHTLAKLAANIATVTPPGATETIWVCDQDDDASHIELAALEQTIVINDGTYPVKTNAGYRHSHAPLIVPTADDVWFHRGWYETAIAAFDDPGVHVVGTRDLTPITQDGRHSTMPIIRREYIENPGCVWQETNIVFHEGYHHGWVETEVWQLAEHRGVTCWVPESVIEHRHPDWGTRPLDHTDIRGNMRGKAHDQALFENRRHAWLSAAAIAR